MSEAPKIDLSPVIKSGAPDEVNEKSKEFCNKMADLIKEFGITDYAGTFLLPDAKAPILIFRPNVAKATLLLKNAHTACRQQVLDSIGG